MSLEIGIRFVVREKAFLVKLWEKYNEKTLELSLWRYCDLRETLWENGFPNNKGLVNASHGK